MRKPVPQYYRWSKSLAVFTSVFKNQRSSIWSPGPRKKFLLVYFHIQLSQIKKYYFDENIFCVKDGRDNNDNYFEYFYEEIHQVLNKRGKIAGTLIKKSGLI
jgi:hypothetical protein